MEKIGKLEMLRRYPVKSMAGEDLKECYVSKSGLVGDRVYLFGGKVGEHFIPLTARQIHEIILFQPRFLEEPDYRRGHTTANYAIEVQTPDGQKFNGLSKDFERYLKERSCKPLKLEISKGGNFPDNFPISIFGLPTLRKLGRETGMELDYRRFRANLYVEWANGLPFYEDELIGKTLQVGDDVKVEVAMEDRRCVMITLDPKTAVSEKKILHNVYEKHEGHVGVYAKVLKEGKVKVGNNIFLV